MKLKTYKCNACKEDAVCVGWMYPWNGSMYDTFTCDEHCDHDCCAGVDERQRDPNWVPNIQKEKKQ